MHSSRIKLLLLIAVSLASACSPQGSSATKSPSPPPVAVTSANSSPAPLTGPFGLLVSSQARPNYTVSIVAVDGKVVASVEASAPAGAPAPMPAPVSTSNTRAYFMDGEGVVRFLSPNGDTGRATTVPIGNTRRSVFAVSPDDKRIAVVVEDFTSSGAATKLYVEDLSGGGHHIDLFSEAGANTLWPTGWHGTNSLVLAKVPVYSGPTIFGTLELHVVDPVTAERRFTLGGPTCLIAGPPAPTGVVCENTDFTQATILNWTGGSVRSFPIHGAAQAQLSPDGSLVALLDVGARATSVGTNRSLALLGCGWIDNSHLLGGGDALSQPRVGDVTNGNIVPVAAQGYCGGRIPGGL